MSDTSESGAGQGDTDEELRLIRMGDSQAFARWLARVEHGIRMTLRSFATNVDTEAVLQEALLRVWKAAPRVRRTGPDSLLRYAVTTARRVAIDELRRGDREIPLDAMDPLPDVEDPRGGPPDPFVVARIRECLDRLPPRPKAALSARLEDGGLHPDRLLASRRGMTLNTFHQNFGRARRLMADCLAAHGVALP